MDSGVRRLWSVPLVLTRPQSYTTRFHSPDRNLIHRYGDARQASSPYDHLLHPLPPHLSHLSVTPLLRPNSSASVIKRFLVQRAVGLLLLSSLSRAWDVHVQIGVIGQPRELTGGGAQLSGGVLGRHVSRACGKLARAMYVQPDKLADTPPKHVTVVRAVRSARYDLPC